MTTHPLRTRWQAGAAAINGWLSIPDSFAAETMAHAGWDSLTIDLQHGLVDYANVVPMLQAIATTKTVPMVRPPWLEPGILMKVLDAGAMGVICPMVNSVDDARRLVQWTRYAPLGARSFGPLRASLVAGADYAQHANDSIVVLAMIETAQALDALDGILEVEGLDGVYIGPSDLSLSLGCRPVLDDVDPPVAQAIDHVLARARARRRIAGIHNGGPEAALARVAKGFQLVTVSSDARLIALGARDVVNRMRTVAR